MCYKKKVMSRKTHNILFLHVTPINEEFTKENMWQDCMKLGWCRDPKNKVQYESYTKTQLRVKVKL